MLIYTLKHPLKYKSLRFSKYFANKKKNYLNVQFKKNYYILFTFFENFYSWRLNASRRINYSKQIILNNFLDKFNFSLNYIVFKLVIKDSSEFVLLRDFFFNSKLVLNLVSKRMEIYLRNQHIDFASFKFLFNGGYAGIVFFNTEIDILNFFKVILPNFGDKVLINNALIPMFLKANGYAFSRSQYKRIIELDLQVSKKALFNSITVSHNLFKLFLLNWSINLNANIKSTI